MIINTNLGAEHLFKFKELEFLFEEYANELDGSGGGFIIYKFFIKDDKVWAVFDLIDTKDFEYESRYDLEKLLTPFIEELDI